MERAGRSAWPDRGRWRTCPRRPSSEADHASLQQRPATAVRAYVARGFSRRFRSARLQPSDHVPIMADFFERVAALRRDGRPFAVATVVARRVPVSAHLGDRAIVFADGRMEGFVGGACSGEIVRQQALEALAARQGRLVSIRPDASETIETADERVVVPMACASEGALDVFIDPIVPPRQLIVVGATPVAEALARLARSMDYDVARIVDARERNDIEAGSATLGIDVRSLDELATVVGERSTQSAAVVASQGHYDEQALEDILKAGVPYVGFVASRKRGATVMSLLEADGVPGV